LAFARKERLAACAASALRAIVLRPPRGRAPADGLDLRRLFPNSRAHVRACIDWTQRRHHISGPLGTALLEALLANGALRRRSQPRALALTEDGREMLSRLLGVDLTAEEIPAG
jgi:hypothetical protein